MRSATNTENPTTRSRKPTALLACSLLILLVVLVLPAPASAGGARAGSGSGLSAPDVASYINNYGVPGTPTYGSPNVFNEADTYDISAAALSDTKFVVAYRDYADSECGKAIIGDVTGNVITYGSEKVFNPAGSEYISVSALSASKFVVAYNDSGVTGSAIIGDVTGNVITYGSEKVFNPAGSEYISVSALSASKFVVAYNDGGGAAVIGDVTGNVITCGSEWVFNTVTTDFCSAAALSASKFVVAYREEDTSYHGTAIIGDVVSGNTITYGSETVFNEGNTNYPSASSLSASKFVVAYSDTDHADYGTAIIGDVAGNAITYGSETVFNTADTSYSSASVLSPSKFVVAYADGGRAGYGTAIIGGIDAPTVQTNAASGVTTSGATLHGNITSIGGEECDARGFQYRKQGSGTWTDWNESAGPYGIGSFNHAISGLADGANYEFKARAHNSAGWVEGGALTFTTVSEASTWYLAEGTTAWGFETYITIENPNSSAVEVDVTYMPTGLATKTETVNLPAMSQTTLTNDHLVSRMGGNYDFSTKVKATDKTKAIAVDRTMTWTGPGAASPEGHSSVGVTAPAKTWYLPEGSTKWGFETWLLIQNPNGTKATCTVTYMIEGETPQQFTKELPANSRRSYSMASDIGKKDASIKVTSDKPVIPERAMYRNSRREGHESIGTTTPATDYYLAEGATGYNVGYITYVLVQNPHGTPTDVEITYLTGSGQVEGPSFQMPANSRKTVRVNDQLPPNTDVSTHVHGTQPIIAERAMYWNNGTGEACHDSIGMADPAMTFYLPDGQTSGGHETWTLVQNPNGSSVEVTISYLTPDGAGNVTFSETIPANSRKTYNMAERGINGRAAILVASKPGTRPIMVERAMYWNSRGAGTDTVGGCE